MVCISYNTDTFCLCFIILVYVNVAGFSAYLKLACHKLINGIEIYISRSLDVLILMYCTCDVILTYTCYIVYKSHKIIL